MRGPTHPIALAMEHVAGYMPRGNLLGPGRILTLLASNEHHRLARLYALLCSPLAMNDMAPHGSGNSIAWPHGSGLLQHCDLQQSSQPALPRPDLRS